jgi:hypothetical protein
MVTTLVRHRHGRTRRVNSNGRRSSPHLLTIDHGISYTSLPSPACQTARRVGRAAGCAGPTRALPPSHRAPPARSTSGQSARAGRWYRSVSPARRGRRHDGHNGGRRAAATLSSHAAEVAKLWCRKVPRGAGSASQAVVPSVSWVVSSERSWCAANAAKAATLWCREMPGGAAWCRPGQPGGGAVSIVGWRRWYRRSCR